MRTLFSFIFILVIVPLNKVCSQYTGGSTKFSLDGIIDGKDTGLVVLWHFDNKNQQIADTVKLNKGKFHFSGTVNRACESLLWTDLKNRNFDDPSVIRLLLEPNNMHISYKVKDPLNPIIKGSKLQTEKEKWDKQKHPLLLASDQVYKSLGSLVKLSKNSEDLVYKNQLLQLGKQRDSIYELIKALDVAYMKMHSDSYLSAYLLSKQKRRLPVDSIEIYYNALGSNIKKSSLGHDVLIYVYPLTDDTAFRKANPLKDIAFSQRLSNLKSVDDL